MSRDRYAMSNHSMLCQTWALEKERPGLGAKTLSCQLYKHSMISLSLSLCFHANKIMFHWLGLRMKGDGEKRQVQSNCSLNGVF